jgi:hypothetical protein
MARHRNFHRYETIRRAWKRGSETTRGLMSGPPIATPGERPRPAQPSKADQREQLERQVAEFLAFGGRIKRR